ncbi:MAG: hypothetical protein QHH01_04095 [Spirochaetales bacterium]|nr:hypothetical protein [Spirochaetales bacterium]
MSVQQLSFAEPFFSVQYIVEEERFEVGTERCILLNVSDAEVKVEEQLLGFLCSTVVTNTVLGNVHRAILIEHFDKYAEAEIEKLYEHIRSAWTLVFDATGLERHKGVQLWRSPKEHLGNIDVNMCYAHSIPLHVGLHKTHWGPPEFREVHTQIIGYGKMQQCRQNDISTLYREDYLAPGCTHQPMYNEHYEYPWHQYETVTRGIFMATEMTGTQI